MQHAVSGVTGVSDQNASPIITNAPEHNEYRPDDIEIVSAKPSEQPWADQDTQGWKARDYSWQSSINMARVKSLQQDGILTGEEARVLQEGGSVESAAVVAALAKYRENTPVGITSAPADVISPSRADAGSNYDPNFVYDPSAVVARDDHSVLPSERPFAAVDIGVVPNLQAP